MNLTKQQIEDVFWLAAVMCLGLNPDEEATSRRVRKMWPTDSESGSNPSWRRSEDVCFLSITPGRADYATPIHITHRYDERDDQLFEVASYTRSYAVGFIFYGPSAQDDADAARINILSTRVRDMLRAHGIYPIPGIQEPIHADELVNGAWWCRRDMTVNFYVGAQRESPVDSYDVPPDINIQGR